MSVYVFVCLCKAEARRSTEAKLGPSQASAQRAETKKPPAGLALLLSHSLTGLGDVTHFMFAFPFSPFGKMNFLFFFKIMHLFISL